MNYTDIFERLVKLLGRSENDPEVMEIFTELGVKFPLKKPKSSEDGYLIEKSKINCYLGISYANNLPYVRDNKNFKEKELVFSDVQDIIKENFPNVHLPFGIHWEMTIDSLNEQFGNYFDTREFIAHDSFMWLVDNIVVIVDFSENKINAVTYRLIYDFDLEKLGI